jgi:hypothetical protein
MCSAQHSYTIHHYLCLEYCDCLAIVNKWKVYSTLYHNDVITLTTVIPLYVTKTKGNFYNTDTYIMQLPTVKTSGGSKIVGTDTTNEILSTVAIRGAL